MLVAVVALAGTAIYAALDHTILTKDGYALPGSTFTYESSGLKNTVIIAGYDNGTYLYLNSYADKDAIDQMESEDELKVTIPNVTIQKSNGHVNVPGIGNTSSTTYRVETETQTATITYILNGLIYDFKVYEETGSDSVTLKNSDAKIGDYRNPDIPAMSFENGSKKATISCVCDSIDDLYLYRINVDEAFGYYLGNDIGIPTNMGNSTSKDIYTNYGDVTITISNDGVMSLKHGGLTYSR